MSVFDLERLRPVDEGPGHRRRAVRKPQADAAVAGGKGNQDSGIESRAQQQMRGDRAVAQETVEIEPFIYIERQSLRRGGAARGGPRQRGGDTDTDT